MKSKAFKNEAISIFKEKVAMCESIHRISLFSENVEEIGLNDVNSREVHLF